MTEIQKRLIIGSTAVATAGLVIGALVLLRSTDANRRLVESSDATTNETTAEDRQKIEDLQWEEWTDEARYGFCLGDVTVTSTYSDPVLNGTGYLSRRGQEVTLLDKTANRLYIMARYDKYVFTGSVAMPMGGLTTVVPIAESGTLNERYDFGALPVRLDYGNNVIYTDPDAKRRDWATSELGDSVDRVAPRTGCAGVFPLDNSPGHDVLIGAEQVIIDRNCDSADISGRYLGEFAYRCNVIDARQARELAEQIAAEERLAAEASEIPEAADAEAVDLDEATAVERGTDGLEPADSPQLSEEEAIRELLRQLPEGVDGSMRAP